MILTCVAWSSPHRPATTAVISFTHFQWHINHSSDNWWSLRNSSWVPRYEPFIYNQEIHIGKETSHKGELRNKLEYKLNISTKIYSISSFDKDSQSHMNNSNDDRNFHFQAVNKIEIILSNCPYRIKPNRINTLLANFRYNLRSNSRLRIITRPKHIQTNGHKIIINPSTIHSKEPHQSNQISMW